MNIPIVSGRQALARGGPGHNIAAELRRAQSVKGSKSLAQDDILKQALTGSGKADASELSPSSVRYDGELPSFLKSLREIAQKISSLRDEVSEGTADQKAAKTQELAALETRFTELLSGDSAKKLTELLKKLDEIVRGGASLDGVARALDPQRGVVGSNYLDLLRIGATDRLSGIRDFINSLGSVDPTGDLSGFINSVTRTETSLSTAPVIEGAKPAVQKAADVQPIAPLEPTESVFELGGNIALKVRGYSSRDLIKAAATGAIKDPSLINQISIELPATDEEKEREKKRERKPKNSGGVLDVHA